jgi:hypothetical protein
MATPEHPRTFCVPEALSELEAFEERFEKDLAAWLSEEGSFLAFDQGLGRFVRGVNAQPGQGLPEFPPMPQKPFFSWRGDPPERLPR